MRGQVGLTPARAIRAANCIRSLSAQAARTGVEPTCSLILVSILNAIQAVNYTQSRFVLMWTCMKYIAR